LYYFHRKIKFKKSQKRTFLVGFYRWVILGGFFIANPGSVSSSSRAQHVAHLAVLGLPASADREAVRQRYLQLVKIHHPDTSTDPDTVDKFR
jgi:DnaJ-domain-containing protein 1